ncbi:MAG: hypothetical protein EDQ89_08175 [Acidobacteria bacterium]|nr:MAG: hypothetical protein EDQ89_08175 [Acidobacteriota bacterium]
MAFDSSAPRRMARAVGTVVLAAVLVLVIAAPAGAGSKHRERHRVDLNGATKMVGGTIIPGPVIDRGTVDGKPFRDGRIKLVVQLDIATATATGSFRIRDDRGTAFGTVDMTFTISGNEITFNGTADFTGGKGRYKGIRGRDLKAYDHNTLDGQNGTIRLKGFVRY